MESKPTPSGAGNNDAHSRRSTLRTKHIRYQKSVKDLLDKLSDPKDATAADTVNNAYSLLRLFSLTYNHITLARDENKAAIPAAFEGELKKILGDVNFNKFSETFEVKGQDYTKSLPESLDALVINNLVKFVQAKEGDHINAKYDAELASLTS